MKLRELDPQTLTAKALRSHVVKLRRAHEASPSGTRSALTAAVAEVLRRANGGKRAKRAREGRKSTHLGPQPRVPHRETQMTSNPGSQTP